MWHTLVTCSVQAAGGTRPVPLARAEPWLLRSMPQQQRSALVSAGAADQQAAGAQAAAQGVHISGHAMEAEGGAAGLGRSYARRSHVALQACWAELLRTALGPPLARLGARATHARPTHEARHRPDQRCHWSLGQARVEPALKKTPQAAPQDWTAGQGSQQAQKKCDSAGQLQGTSRSAGKAVPVGASRRSSRRLSWTWMLTASKAFRPPAGGLARAAQPLQCQARACLAASSCPAPAAQVAGCAEQYGDAPLAGGAPQAHIRSAQRPGHGQHRNRKCQAAPRPQSCVRSSRSARAWQHGCLHRLQTDPS